MNNEAGADPGAVSVNAASEFSMSHQGGAGGTGLSSHRDQGSRRSMTAHQQTGLTGQLNMDRKHAQEAKKHKALEKKVCSTYNRSFMPSNDKKELSKSL